MPARCHPFAGLSMSAFVLLYTILPQAVPVYRHPMTGYLWAMHDHFRREVIFKPVQVPK